MGTIDYSGWLPHVDPSTVPYTFHIVMGHILDSHAFDEGKKYDKSMFCQDLSDEESLRKLIIFAFVDEFGGPNSSGPNVIDVGASIQNIPCYGTNTHMAWGGPVMVGLPAVCICGTCATGERYTFAKHGQRKLLSFGMFLF